MICLEGRLLKKFLKQLICHEGRLLRKFLKQLICLEGRLLKKFLKQLICIEGRLLRKFLKQLICHERSDEKWTGGIVYSFIEWMKFFLISKCFELFYDICYDEYQTVRSTCRRYLLGMAGVSLKLAMIV